MALWRDHSYTIRSARLKCILRVVQSNHNRILVYFPYPPYRARAGLPAGPGPSVGSDAVAWPELSPDWRPPPGAAPSLTQAAAGGALASSPWLRVPLPRLRDVWVASDPGLP